MRWSDVTESREADEVNPEVGSEDTWRISKYNGVARGRTAPADTLQRVTPDLKLFFVAEFRKNTG